jgi:hypothetical protein
VVPVVRCRAQHGEHYGGAWFHAVACRVRGGIVTDVTFPGGSVIGCAWLGTHPTGDDVYAPTVKAPVGNRWQLRRIPNGARFVVRGLPYEKTGSTRATVRLRPVGVP